MAQLTRAQLIAELNSLITDPLQRQNSAARVRQIITDIIDSDVNVLDDLKGIDLWVSGSTGNQSLKANNNSGLDAQGDFSVAEGFNTIASGNFSHAEGADTQAIGDSSHAEGYSTQANGEYSHAEGYSTQANGRASFAGGRFSEASGSTSFAFGLQNQANGDYSVVLGGYNITGNTDSTVYVPYLNIQSANTDNTLANLLAQDSNGNINLLQVSAITENFIPLSGTSTANTLTGVIIHSNGGNDALASNTSGGFNIGYGNDLANIYGSSTQYAAASFTQLQTYLQFYDNITNTGAELNLAGSDGSGGNGTFAQISAYDNVGDSGSKIEIGAGSIVISGFNTGGTNAFAGIQYYADFSPYYTIRSLVDKNYVDTHITTATTNAISGTTNYVPIFTSSSTLGNSLISQGTSGITLFGSVEIYGNVDINGTASTFNTTIVQTKDNNITMNLSGSHVSAIGGGITVLSGTPNGVASTWLIDANGAWSANTLIQTSAITINGGAIISGSTNLYGIFAPLGSGTQALSNGLNTYTGGTNSIPTINVSALTINTLTASGNTSLQGVTATTLNLPISNNNIIFSKNGILSGNSNFLYNGVGNVNSLVISNITNNSNPMIQLIGDVVGNTNMPSIQFKGGNIATTYPTISTSNGGTAFVMTGGVASGLPSVWEINGTYGILSICGGTGKYATQFSQITGYARFDPTNTLSTIEPASPFICVGNAYFGSNSVATAIVQIAGATTGTTSLRLTAGLTPASPNNGDLWNDGTNLNINGLGLNLKTQGSKINIATGGTASSVGSGILVAGLSTINTTSVTSSSKIFVSDTGGGVLANIGSLYSSNITGGTGFQVSSTNVLDTSSFNWIIIN